MPRELHPFHIHTLDEIDFAQRIWGPAGVRAVLGVPEPHARLPLSVEAPTPAPERVGRALQPRTGFVWAWLRRAPRAAVR